MKARVELRQITTGFYEVDVPDSIVQDSSDAVVAWLNKHKHQFPIEHTQTVVEIPSYMLLDKPADYKEYYIRIPIEYLKHMGEEVVEIFINENKDRFITVYRSCVQDDSLCEDFSTAEYLFVTIRNDLFYTVKELFSCNLRCGASAIMGSDLVEELEKEDFCKIQ